MANKRDKTIAYKARQTIKEFWNKELAGSLGERYHKPSVHVDHVTAVLTSDMHNGYPPSKKVVRSL